VKLISIEHLIYIFIHRKR